MRSDYPEPTLTRLAPQQLVLLLLAPLLLWPAIVNGGAFFFSDTSSYIRTIDALAVRVIDRPSDWTTERTMRVMPATARHATPVRSSVIAAAEAPVLAGRSPYYGALAYLGVLGGSFWIVLAIQALAAMTVVLGAMRHAVSPERHRAFAVAVAGAAALMAITPLPFYVSMLMPDLFAGLAIVAAAVLLTGWRRETRAGRLGWLALAAYGALTHSATMLILLAMVAAAALLWVLRRRAAPAGVALVAIAAAALTGLVGEMLCGAVVERMIGHPPIRPPFITARLTADGVGTDYLRRHCGTEHWLLCRYRARLPAHSDSFLWSDDPANGVFMTIPPAQARALSAEQVPFVLAVLRDRPVAVIRSSGAAILDQATQVGLTDFHYTAQEYAGFVERVPPALAAQLRDTGAFRRTLPLAPIVALAWPLFAISLALIGWAWTRPALREQALLGAWALFGWGMNVAICGAMSTPHDRYNMRVLWMLPLAAAVIAAAAIRRERGAPRLDAAVPASI